MGELDPDQSEMLNIALSGGQILLSMINDLLDVSKMESGSLELEYQPVAAADVVGQALSQVAPLAKADRIALISNVPADMAGFQADGEKLRRVLVNLIGNALKFTPEGGTVTVAGHMDTAAQRMIFAVSDTGEGIPREAFEQIFEKFGQVSGRAGGRYMSTGLGLTFCKMAVEAHGGHIWVESELGKGSTFSFSIPTTTPADANASRQSAGLMLSPH